jgi:hypothetical protein
MADLDRVKRNISRMISVNAPETDIDQYIASEGVSLDQIRAHKIGTAAAPAKPDMSLGEIAGDVGKSTGIGLAQGAIGLATLPGNLEGLGRAGINAAAGLVGAQPPVSGETVLPTYDDWKKRVEGVTGEFYEPKSTAGEYARTIGEFAPLAIPAIMTGGVAAAPAAAGAVAGPAIVSETAGQVARQVAPDYEPLARAAGALTGGRAPNAAARVVTPVPANAQRAAQVATLEQEGVTALTAGQRTGNPRLRQIEDATAMFPGGGRATQMQNQAAEQYTAAALRRAGVNGNRADPDTIRTAFDNIGQEYQAFAQGRTILNNPTFSRRLQNILNNYTNVTSDATRVRAIEAGVQDLIRRPNLSGTEYGAIRRQLGKLQRDFQKSQNVEASQALRQVVEALDTQAVRSVPRPQRAQVAAELADRNRRYRNLVAIEDAVGRGVGEASANGLITPAALKAAVKKQNRQDYTRGRGELAPLARAGENVLAPLKSSGTAERNLAQEFVKAPSTAYGALAGGIMSAGDPATALAGALIPQALKFASARGINSRPLQAYLANQRIPQQIPNEVDPNLARMLAAYLASQDAPQQ